MPNGIDSSALAEYLAAARGENVVPSFSDGKDPEQDTTDDPEFFQVASDFAQVAFNPFAQAQAEAAEVEQQQQVELRAAEERDRISRTTTRPDPANITTLEAGQQTRDSVNFDMQARLQREQDAEYEKQNVPQLMQQLQTLTETGLARSGMYENTLAKYNQAVEMAHRQITIDEKGNIGGLRAREFVDDQNYLKTMDSRLLILDREHQANLRLSTSEQAAKNDENRKVDATIASARARYSLTTDVSDFIEGLTEGDSKVVFGSMTQDTATWAKQAANDTVESGTSWSMADYSAADPLTQEMMRVHKSKISGDIKAAPFIAKAEEWSKIAEASVASQREANKARATQANLKLGTPAYDAFMRDADRTERHASIDRSQKEFKAANANTGMFRIANLPENASTAQKEVSSFYAQEILRTFGDGTQLSNIVSGARGSYNMFRFKSQVKLKAETYFQHTYSQLDLNRYFDDLIEAGRLAYNKDYAHITGKEMRSDDPLIAPWRF